MRGFFLSLSHPPPILLVGLVLLSTHFLWAQRTATPEKSAVHLPDTPSRVATVSEAQTHFRLAYSFGQNQGQAESRISFFPHYPRDDRLPINLKAALQPASRTAELWGKEKYGIGSVPSNWLTFAPTFGRIPQETTCCVGNLEHYVHRIPGAGFVMLRIGQQAKAHPHVTRVLTVFRPEP